MTKKENKKTAKKREIPRRNYFIALFVIIAVVLVTIYSFNLYKLNQEEKLSKSYLMSSNTILYEIKIEELDSVLLETPNEYYLYISYTNSKEVYELETDLKKIIEDYGLKDHIYYLNVTSIKDEEDYIDRINNALNIEPKITKVPTILYFKDGDLVIDGIVAREDENIIQAGDFEHLLEKLEIPKVAK